MGITTVDVVSDNLMAWGVQVHDYELNGKVVDFQDIMIYITEQRAASIEKEVEPLSVRMETRNGQLDALGEALSIISEIQSKFDSDDHGEEKSDTALNADAVYGLKLVGCTRDDADQDVAVGIYLKLSKAHCELYQQRLKTMIDSLNNAASKDMTRLQSLVDKRDESYSTATTLMQQIGDTRANTIKNM